jgi:hypothetical protein
MTGALVLFALFELLLIVVFSRVRYVSGPSYLVNVYTMCFVSATPALVGGAGLVQLRKLLSGSNVSETTARSISRLLLTGIILTYGTLIFVAIVLMHMFGGN